MGTRHFFTIRWFTVIAFCLVVASTAYGQVLTFDQAKQRADAGDAFAQAVVALHYQLGWNTEKNPELAVKYALASAKAGSPLGQFRLGALLRAGEGVPKDEERGLSFQAAAAEGLNRSKDPYSLTALGVLIFQGKAVAQDVPQAERYKEAARLYKLAAGGAPGDWTSGFAPAAFNYAMCADAGHGMAKNPDDKQAYLGKALHQKYPPALKYLEEQKTRFSGSEYDQYKVPKTEPDILNAAVNPETKVWEKASEKGRTSKWAAMSATEDGSLAVDVRTQYSDYPLMLQAHEFEFNMSSGGNYQSLRSSAQYHVGAETESSIEIGPTLPMEQRNLWGLTEYPAILEFKVTNNSHEEVSLRGLQLDVLECVPIRKNIVGITCSDQEMVMLHDFGWGSWPNEKIEMALVYNYPPTGTSPIVQPYKELNGGLGAQTKIRADSNADYYSYGGTLLVRNTPETPAGAPVHVKAFSIADSGYGLVRLPADVVLPSNRSGYSLVYPIETTLAAGETRTFTISLSAQESASFVLAPIFKTSFGTQQVEKTLRLTIETIRPVEREPVETVLGMQSNDVVPYAGFQSEVLGSFVSGQRVNPSTESESPKLGTPYSDYQRPTLLSEDFNPREFETLKDENDNLATALGQLHGSQRLKPAVFAVDRMAMLSRSEESVIHRFETPSALTLTLTGANQNAQVDGHFEISQAGGSNSLAFRAPWSLDGVSDSVEIQYALGRQADWIALRATANGKARIYLFFPRQTNLCFSLPFLPEHLSKSIASSPDGNSLLVELESGEWVSVDLWNSLVSQLVLVPESGGDIEPYQTDIDALGRVRLWLPYASVADPNRDVIQPTVCKIKNIPSANEDVSVSWLSDLQLGVGQGEKWKIWNLANGTLRTATSEESRALSKSKGTIRFKGEADTAHHIGDISREAKFTASGENYTILELGYDSPPYNRSWEITCEGRTKSAGSGWAYFRLTPYGTGRYHSRRQLFSASPSISPNQKYLAVSNLQGTEIWLVDLGKLELAAKAVASPSNSNVFTLVTPDGDYMSGDGQADGCVLSNGTSAIPLSRMEAKFNRPDIVLERVDADESLIKEAKRLRERLVRRSDFKSFDGATLIDIPVVTVKSEVPEKTSGRTLRVYFDASNSTGPLKELRVFNNGALVKTLELNGKDGQPSREASGEVEIDLASGENRLQLMAVSEEGFTSSFAEKRVNCTAEPDSRRCFIAAVGVSEYNDTRFNLKFAAKDAEDMSKALAVKARHRGYQPEVLVVRNAEVDSGLVDKLREFLSQAGTDDEVVLFFAGHGLLDKDLEYHFARHNTDFDATENMGITFEALESLVDGIKPLKRTVLFDTCHSGEVEEEDKPQLLAMVGSGDLSPAADADTGVQVRGIATRGMKVTGTEPKLRHADFVELEGLFPDSRRAKGANILTSSSGSEFSMESDAWQNGLFTYAFLNALQDEKTDANGDKSVSFHEVAAAVQERVKTLSGGHQRPITRGVNRETDVALASFGPPVEPVPTKEKKSGWWPF
jgi:hypothetical protein